MTERLSLHFMLHQTVLKLQLLNEHRKIPLLCITSKNKHLHYFSLFLVGDLFLLGILA